MNRSILLALVSFLFAVISTLVIYFLCVSFGIKTGLLLIFIVFSTSFFISFLVFYFSYEISVYNRIKNITERVSLLGKIKNELQQTLINIPKEGQDPLKLLDEKIIQLEEDRQEEIERLKKLENHRKEFLGNVSHELKTPIFNIQGYVSTLIDGGIYDKTINLDYLKRADKSIDRMIRIIDDLEIISNLESGVMEPDLDTFDLLELSKDVFLQLEIYALAKKITFDFLEDYSSPIIVIADKFRIRQVLVNLATNSIKYGKENGKTIIGFLVTVDEISIYVNDDGIGISEVHLPRLFERFYRVDKGRSREQGGTGLGLAIVKHILEAHYSIIKVSSKVGVGSTFSFSLKKG
jgi:two-component system phosphate regulon sensor histidine kinase PhoR